jgi:short-subunit dehydrogenase
VQVDIINLCLIGTSKDGVSGNLRGKIIIFEGMKRAIIIGATSGIGKSLCGELVRKGYMVGITGRRSDLLQSIRDKDPERIHGMVMDVRELSTLESQCKAMVHELGGMDLLVISAGIGLFNKELDHSKEEETIRTNISGFTCVADWGMRYFKEQGYGHLVAITSVAGIRGNGTAPAYNASKAFQINYLEGLRINAEKSKLSIQVTDIRPGFVDTDMAKGEGMFWITRVDRAAKQISDAILKKRKVVYISKRWGLVALLLSLIPYQIYRKL